MDEIEAFIQKYNKPLTHEQVNKVIYNAFAIIIFCLPIIPEIRGVIIYSLKYTIFNLTTIVTSLVLVILNIKNIKNTKWNVYDILLLIYLNLVGISTIFTNHGVVEAILGTNGRGEGFITICSYIATFVIFSRGYKHIIKTVRIAVIAALVVSIYAFIQANAPRDIQLPFMEGTGQGIATGTMQNQNFLSSYICIFLPAMCYYYINSKKHSSLMVVSLLFMTLVSTVTQGGYITFVSMYVAVVILSILFSNNRKNTIIRIGIVTAVLVCIFFLQTYINGNVYVNEVKRLKTEANNLASGSDKFGSSRMEIWRRTIAVIKNNAWLGTGPDSLYPEFRYGNYVVNGENDILNRYLINKAHSEPLQIAATTGVPSAMVYLLFATVLSIKLLITAIKNIKQKGIEDKHTIFITAILISILSYLMQSMINISVIQVAPIFWAMLGIGAGITLNDNINKN